MADLFKSSMLDYNFNILKVVPTNTTYCKNGLIDKASFFHEATLRLCGTLNLEEAFSSFFSYLQTVTPVSSISISQTEFEQKKVSALVYCEPNSTLLFYSQFILPPARADLVEKLLGRTIHDEANNLSEAGIFLTDADGELANFMNSYSKKLVPPLFFMRIRSDYDFYVGVIFTFPKDKEVTPEHLELLHSLKAPLLMALRNGMHYKELEELKTSIAKENLDLKNKLSNNVDKNIIGTKSGLVKVMQEASLAAYTDVPVLIQGETGVGKEIVAQTIHSFSKRKDKSFIAVNCGAIPPSLIDSELFGHVKGAFTGAIKDHKGYFEQAHGGTLFLDEIGELPIAMQSRLLRVLQEKTIRRIGSTAATEVDFRLIVATHRDLRLMVEEGTFREDLYYRLKVVNINVPPLRERKEDIPLLVTKFLQEEARNLGILIPKIPQSEIDRLIAYDWYGNIRELKNIVLEALVLNPQGPLRFKLEGDKYNTYIQEKTVSNSSSNPQVFLSYDEMEAKYFKELLVASQGRIAGPFGAAAKAGIKPNTMRFRLDKLNIPYGRKNN